MNLVRFSFFYHNTSINRIVDHDTLAEVEAEGLEKVANKCIDEIKQSLNLDLKQLTYPEDHSSFCSFIQLKFNPDNNEITEKKSINLK